MDNFEKAESKGKELLKSFLDQAGATEQHPTEYKYNPVDYYFTYKGKTAVAEIKNRDIKYLDYDTHLIERIKLNELMKAKAEDKCDAAFYANFFGEDNLYLYRTEEIIKASTTSRLMCNSTTAEDTGIKEKDVLFIPSTSAQKFVRIDGKWTNNKQYGA